MKSVTDKIIAAGLLMFISAASQAQHTLWLDDLSIQTYSEGIRPVQAKTSYAKEPLVVKGVNYSRGLGAISISVLAFQLDGHASGFTAKVVPDEKGNKEIGLRFFVVADQKVLFETKTMHIGDDPIPVNVDLKGVRQLGLLVTDSVGGVANKKTYANWLDAKLDMKDAFVPAHVPINDKPYILTPHAKQTPAIHSPKLFGATPGNPVLYTIAATGKRPMQFAAQGLPDGLQLDASTGIISGAVKQKGNYIITLRVSNALGKAEQKTEIRIGDTIALTPPMGWNGWNSWAAQIDQEKVVASANAMVSKGLRDHGWTYVNIDDSWQGVRAGPDTALQPNEKFPAMKKLVDHIHSLGLKAGIYSTPYISSYGMYVGGSSAFPAGGERRETFLTNKPTRMGTYHFDRNDAKQWARWGFDFLKYDWRIDVASTESMSNALKQSGRDIVFSLSNNAPFEKVNEWVRLSQMYRTGPDIKDSWTSLFTNVFSLDKWSPYTGHGHWADPDMMIVGDVSIGPEMHPTRLTPDEQYSHISIYSLLAAPMLIGCPIERLDDFTLSLLTNDEVIAVNQDTLGRAARLVLEEEGIQTWLKPLADGSFAIGLFNTGGYGTTPASYFRWGNEPEKKYQLSLAKIGMKGSWMLRDLWRQTDKGTVQQLINASIPHHGVMLYRIIPVLKYTHKNK